MAILIGSKKYGGVYAQGVAPSNPIDGDTWYDTVNKALMSYSLADNHWYTLSSSWAIGSNYGYNMGGLSTSYISNIDRITFPFNSGTSSVVGGLSIGKYQSAGCNSSNYGYCMGGSNATVYLSSIDRITFPFNSGTSSAVGNLSGTRYFSAGCDGTDFVTLFT